MLDWICCPIRPNPTLTLLEPRYPLDALVSLPSTTAMRFDPRNPDSRKLMHDALQQGVRALLSAEDMRNLRVVFPNVVDGFVTSATFRDASAEHLGQATAKWPSLERVTLHPTDSQDDDNVAIIDSFTGVHLPQLTELTLRSFGRTDPAREAAALAAGRWPKLKNLALHIVASAPWTDTIDPGLQWTRAMATLSKNNWKVDTLHLMVEAEEEERKYVEFPLPDIARCFPLTLNKLCLGYPMGRHAAAALAAAPLPGPQVTHVQLWGRGTCSLDALAQNSMPWVSVRSFSAEDCVVTGNLDGLGAALPAMTDLWITFEQLRLRDNTFCGLSMLRSLEATSVRKIVLKWAPIGVLQSAAGARLPALRVLSLRYTHLPWTGPFTAAEEGMNALLQADLPVLEKMSISFGPLPWMKPDERAQLPAPNGPIIGQWGSLPSHEHLPENPWPALRSLSLEGLYVCRDAAEFLQQQILPRVAEVQITPQPDV